ncbi:hypothetical protein BBJ28_00018559 [Nothophytophthora sp. Chile5]|nr:hypothetical protein BBJ28_00018559 [Nothophytophthora sp. Chile5]
MLADSRAQPHGVVAAEAPPDLVAELRLLKEEVHWLKAELHSSQRTPVERGQDVALDCGTLPNAKSEMPPAEARYLTGASFPEDLKKAKGDYHLPQAHMLAASRISKTLGTDTGKRVCPMSFVLGIREAERVRFRTTPVVLMAVFSGRVGSRGLTVMHFREASEFESLEHGSSNANFASDFSPSVNLPTADTRCGSYDDILDALHGLSAFGNEVWFDHMR